MNSSSNENNSKGKSLAQGLFTVKGTNKLARWLGDFKRNYKLSLIFDLVNLALSLACCGIHIFSTYVPEIVMNSQEIFLFNFIARVYILFDFIMNLLTVKFSNKFYFYVYFFVETVSALPFIILQIISIGMKNDLTSSAYNITSALICIRIFRIQYLNTYISSQVSRELYNIMCSIISLLFFSAAMINVIENVETTGKYWLFLPRDCENDCEGSNDYFHTSFFFILTTVSTLGYYSPVQSGVGRFVIIVIIVVSIIEIPKKSSELMKQLSVKSVYARTTYKKLEKVEFILITGNISYVSMKDLLLEYFHPDHGENERHALILLPHSPDSNIKSLLQEYQNRLYYFEGDPSREIDLKRCQFRDASMIIIMCNKQTDDSTAEDAKTIIQAMAIRKFLAKEDINTKVSRLNENKMLIQLLRPESEQHFALSISKKNSPDQILCIDELKLSLLAKSCLCKGIIALISNLIMTSNLDDVSDKILEENKWLKEYKTGKAYEIYKIQLDFLRGYTFKEVCQLIYKENKVILFGLNLEAKEDGSTIVLLNPSDFFIPYARELIICGYVLAENLKDAESIVIWSQMKKRMSTRSIFVSGMNKTVGLHRKLSRRRSTILSEDQLIEIEDNETQGGDKDNDLYSTDAITFAKICHITTEPIDRASITLESIDNMLIAKGHIIICGVCHNLIDFVKPLRTRNLPKCECPTIVILSKELPDEKIWNTIAFFDQIYLIQGDPMNKTDLKRAGIRFAQKVVILPPRIQEISQFTMNKRKKNENSDLLPKQNTARKLTREEEDLLDAKTIFKYNMISRMKKDIFIVVELINPKNVAFMNNKGRKQNDEYRFIKANMNIDGTASFASGEVYFSSIMDNLITQVYYNPNLLSVLKKMILGEDQSKFKNTPLVKFKDTVSSNLYLIDIPKYVFENDDETKFGNRINDMFGEGVKRAKFSEVFLNMLQKNIVTIGVYKANESTNTEAKASSNNNFDKLFGTAQTTTNTSGYFYYVVTSPEPGFVVTPIDKLFVFSQVFPDDDFLYESEVVEGSEEKEPNNLSKNDNDDNLKWAVSNKIRRLDDKKDMARELDFDGEDKIKGLNMMIIETIESLKDIENSIFDVKDKITENLNNSLKKKVNEIYLTNPTGI